MSSFFNANFHVMAKPIGPACNLRCRYCFYLEKEAIFKNEASHRMSDEVLETYIRKYISSQKSPEILFSWQGGEPTMLGLEFFERVIELQQKHSDGRPISNTLQTNGTLLDDDWSRFLKRHNFLVGLSIDGPEAIHNRDRIRADGKGSFDDVMRGLECLKRNKTEFNTLSCVTSRNAGDAAKIYRFLKKIGSTYMQFIPIVERKPDQRALDAGMEFALPPLPGEIAQPEDVCDFSVTGEQWGQFLIDVFKVWVKKDIGTIFVNHFDVALAGWMGMNPPLCSYAKTCGDAVALEHDGTLYSCDHFVYKDFKLGNIMEKDFDQLMFQTVQMNFGANKWKSLTAYCKACPYLKYCHGDCPKHRFIASPDGEAGLSWLCHGFEKWFKFANPFMQEMCKRLQQQRPCSEIMSLPMVRNLR